jgi:hypothetical protein
VTARDTSAASAASAAKRRADANLRMADKLKAAGWRCYEPRDTRPTDEMARGAVAQLNPTADEMSAMLRFLAGHDPRAVIRACEAITTFYR